MFEFITGIDMTETGFGGFSWLDILIVAIVILSIIFGLARGMVKTVVSIATWMAAIYLAYTFAEGYSYLLESYIDNEDVRKWITGIVLFIIILIIGAIIGSLLHQLIVLGGIKGIDSSLGMILGAVLGVVIVATLILASGLTNFTDTDLFKSSGIFPYLMDLVNWMRELLPEDIQKNIHFPSDGQQTALWFYHPSRG